MLLLHQGLGAELAGAADFAETEFVAIERVRRKPVVAAAVTVGPTIVSEGDGQVAVIHQGTLADPLQDVATILLQLHRLGGAAKQAGTDDRGQSRRFIKRAPGISGSGVLANGLPSPARQSAQWPQVFPL